MTLARADRLAPPPSLRRAHLVGIGGAGMSGIARVLLGRGAVVTGSEIKQSRALAALRAAGAHVTMGQDPANVGNVDAVIVSTAIPDTNVEVVEARRRGIPVVPRAAALAELMAGTRGVAIAGTHGKTTTTSMLTVALQHCGADPSFAIGGDLNEAGSNAHAGSGDVFVAEADESDGSFLLLTPYCAVVTNVEADHLDHYGTPEAVTRAFEAFMDRVEPSGVVVLSADDPGARGLAPVARGHGHRVVLYGEAADAEIHLSGLAMAGTGSSARLVSSDGFAGELRLRVPGRHNARNAAGAFAAGHALGYPAHGLLDGMAMFVGARRRFEPKGEAGGVRVVDDYAHHPTEIEATLRAARQIAGDGRLVAIFQPHRYSRTAFFARQLGEALGLADEVIVMEVYSAGEDPLPGVSGASVASAVPLAPKHVHFEPSWSKAADEVVARCRPGDVVLTLGAGDVTMVGPEVIHRLTAV